jgi:hypothetical protein
VRLAVRPKPAGEARLGRRARGCRLHPLRAAPSAGRLEGHRPGAAARAATDAGGILRLSDVVYDFPPELAEQRLEAWCSFGGDDPSGQWSRAEYEEHVRDEHATFTWLLEPMFQRASFAIVEAVHSKDGIFAQYLLRAV